MTENLPAILCLRRCRRSSCRCGLRLAFPSLVADEAASADFSNAAVFLDFESLAANQRTKARLVLLDGIKRAERRNLDLEFLPRPLVEFRHGLRRLLGPFAVGRTRIAADSFEMELQQPPDIGLV